MDENTNKAKLRKHRQRETEAQTIADLMGRVRALEMQNHELINGVSALREELRRYRQIRPKWYIDRAYKKKFGAHLV